MIEIFHSFTPDLSWRYAQVKNAEKKEDKVAEEREWDAYSQRELKSAISTLLHVEKHPVFGKDIARIIKEIKPMLAQSMEGKKIAEQAQKERSKAERHLYKGFQHVQCDWKDWKKEIPVANTMTSKKKKV